MILASVATSDEMKELVEVLLVVTRLVEVALTAVRLVVDALVRYAFVAVIPVAEALLSVVCPFTTRLLEIDTLVVDAFPSVVWPVTVSVDAVVVARVEVPVTTKELVVVAF